MISLSDIESAQKVLQPVVHRTPLLSSRTFNDLTGNEVYFKAENFQRIGAFKIRGAYNKIASLTDGERNRGIVAHSSGNHAQGVALACRLLDLHAVIVMPENSVPTKVEATKSYGAEVVFCGPTTDDRERVTADLIFSHGYVFVPPYDDDQIIAGQGTVALEILEDLKDVEYLVAPIGGGGLISGCAIAVKSRYPHIRIIGVETEGANDCYQSYRTGSIVKLASVNTIADGMRTLSVGVKNFEIIKKYVDDVVTVSDSDVIAMMKFFHERMKVVVEPTGAVAAAAIFTDAVKIREKRICAIISGGNVDPKMYKAIL